VEHFTYVVSLIIYIFLKKCTEEEFHTNTERQVIPDISRCSAEAASTKFRCD